MLKVFLGIQKDQGGENKMGIFTKKRDSTAVFVKDAIPLSLTNLTIVTIMTLVIVQAIGLIFNITSIKLGPVFILIAVGMSASMSIAAFRKVNSDHLELTKKDVFAIIIVMGLTLVLMFFLRDFVPEIFQQGMVQMQSMMGL